ncbi:MAG TPA: hypothetical protein VJQ25_03350 [Nitrospira sp.]|nr:hypothetical protein [Nitrospira sp.]
MAPEAKKQPIPRLPKAKQSQKEKVDENAELGRHERHRVANVQLSRLIASLA